MQGSYKSNGLPRPYYMKPSKRKHSPYANLKEPVSFFNTPRRKLMGYITVFLLISTLMWWLSQDLKDRPDKIYELVPETDHPPENKLNLGKSSHNLDDVVKNAGSKADKEIENLGLAENLAAGPKGEKGKGVLEAPKGGIANEAPVVGSDEDKIVGSGQGNQGKHRNVEKSSNAGGKGAVGDANEGEKKKVSNKEKVQQIILESH